MTIITSPVHEMLRAAEGFRMDLKGNMREKPKKGFHTNIFLTTIPRELLE